MWTAAEQIFQINLQMQAPFYDNSAYYKNGFEHHSVA